MELLLRKIYTFPTLKPLTPYKVQVLLVKSVWKEAMVYRCSVEQLLRKIHLRWSLTFLTFLFFIFISIEFDKIFYNSFIVEHFRMTAFVLTNIINT